MKECTETGKQGSEKPQVSTDDKTGAYHPMVSIVLATYNPRMDWLKEQLDSLEDQTYRPLELLIVDDCSTKVGLDELQDCVEVCIRSIPYHIMQNEENLGSTKTFEKLTTLVQGEYIAYCDQDDIWQEDKIEILIGCFIEDNINLVYSDVQLINERGEITANSITALRKRHLLYEGSGLAEKLLIQNFVIGCTMLIKSDVAKSSIPFITKMVHDHYLALMASIDGELALYKNPLVFYRIHEENQTNTLTRVKDKKDYYNYKIQEFLDRILQLENRKINEKVPGFSRIKEWANARVAYYNGDVTQAKTIWKYRKYDYNVSVFELFMLKVPDFVFKYALNKIIRGKI